jgi:hypothetical protein
LIQTGDVRISVELFLVKKATPVPVFFDDV